MDGQVGRYGSVTISPQTQGKSLVAVTAATGLYILHNALYAAFSMVAGAVADRMNKGRLLALGYALAGSMALAIVLLPPGPWTLGLIFVLGGVSVAGQ